ncbi:hypothetical protein XFPR_12495 [Xylella fastidiosa]|nr:hypothetical protein [Xylella fastidiosa]QPB72996.1 hypothetical protein XFPR_12495 [Xylella fastidiosa]
MNRTSQSTFTTQDGSILTAGAGFPSALKKNATPALNIRKKILKQVLTA